MVLRIQDRALQEKIIGYGFLALMAVIISLMLYKGVMLF
jgi:hypothetical protein